MIPYPSMTVSQNSTSYTNGRCVRCGRDRELGDGLCIRCWDLGIEKEMNHKQPKNTLPGATLPTKQKQTTREANAARAARYAYYCSTGLCRQCGKVKAKSLCPRCSRRKSVYQKTKRDKSKADKVCILCHRNRTERYVHCESCRQKIKLYPSRRGSK